MNRDDYGAAYLYALQRGNDTAERLFDLISTLRRAAAANGRAIPADMDDIGDVPDGYDDDLAHRAIFEADPPSPEGRDPRTDPRVGDVLMRARSLYEVTHRGDGYVVTKRPDGDHEGMPLDVWVEWAAGAVVVRGKS